MSSIKSFPLSLKCTKIVATIGPSITLKLDAKLQKKDQLDEYDEVLKLFSSLFVKGLNCIRFNFSHSNADERLFRLQVVREAKKRFYRLFNRLDDLQLSEKGIRFVLPFSELCDTKGPEIRVWKMGDSINGQLYSRGQSLKIYCLDKKIGGSEGFSVCDSTGKYNMSVDCTPGSKVLLDDGKLSLSIQNVREEEGIIEVCVENDHWLKSNKRVNLPNASYTLPFLSEKDKDDILFSVENGFPIIALSFVNKAEDILSVKKFIRESSERRDFPLIFSKIESSQALREIDSIISTSDGIMIARGDLGLESPYYEVPYWTKEILKKASRAGKPVIIATQMLDSLERNVVATRAEVSDVYRAVELGTDSTMLSGETAQGLFPEVAVGTMSEIIKFGESKFNYEKFNIHFLRECRYERLNRLSSQLFAHQDKFNYISACFLFDDSLLEEEIFSLSRLKLPFPFIIFSRRESYEEAQSDLTLQFSSVFRGIYRVAILGLENESLEECSREFLYLFHLSKFKPEIEIGDSKEWFCVYEPDSLRVVSIDR